MNTPPSYNYGPPAHLAPARRSIPVWAWMLICLGIILVVLCCIGMLFGPEKASRDIGPLVDLPAGEKPSASASTAPSAPREGIGPEPVKATSVPAPKPAPSIEGDDLVLVGEDVPAGTYRVSERISTTLWCYWGIYRDANKTDIIANDIVTSGRPAVTLKDGQWFKTSGCPDWIKK